MLIQAVRPILNIYRLLYIVQQVIKQIMGGCNEDVNVTLGLDVAGHQSIAPIKNVIII